MCMSTRLMRTTIVSRSIRHVYVSVGVSKVNHDDEYAYDHLRLYYVFL